MDQVNARMRRIEQRRAEVYPLEKLPLEKRDEIAWLVAQETPPERWLGFEMCQMESRAWYEWHWARGIEPRGRREKIPASLRRLVIERDGLTCQLCRGPVGESDIHLDHIVPWSRGGLNTLGNLQVTHSLCNMRKGAKFCG